MWSRFVAQALLFGVIANCAPLVERSSPEDPWYLERFSNLITFGDSYTDENNLNYFILHNGTTPPPGTFLPETFSAPSGGRTWPRYVIQYTGEEVSSQFVPQMTLYDYAVSGAVCSNDLTPRIFSSVGKNFPSVLQDEIPLFKADIKSERNGTNMPYFQPALTATNAVYAIWIGTNDLGVNAILTDSQVAGVTITDYTNCVFSALDELYKSGGRYFVVNNMAPLQLSALYSNLSSVAGPSPYWPNKPSNLTAIAEQMKEYVTTINNVYRYQIPYEVQLANRYPDANFALFDVYSLIYDIYTDPHQYLNGSAPPDVAGFYHHCNLDGTVCSNPVPSPDSFLWYDELHPSEQADRIIAGEFVQLLKGTGKYATYY